MTAETAESIVPSSITIVKPEAPLAVKTTRALVLQQALEEEREQRALLSRYVKEFMVEGEDYGTIPGVKKKSLFKPGAEKLTDLFRCRPEYEVMAKEVNHETGLFYYEIRCRAVNRETDTVLNEGVGSASSYESKYRYRNSARVCPACQKPTISKSKFPPKGSPRSDPGGWYCNSKNGGCGAEFAHDDQSITGQETGKVQNPDLADVANVVLKMAKKRAQVDCALALARVSDMFTQDVEDLVDHAEAAQDKPPAAPPKQAASSNLGTALWMRLKDARGDRARKLWDMAAAECGFKVIPQPQTLTTEQVGQMEVNLFPPAADDGPTHDGIPF